VTAVQAAEFFIKMVAEGRGAYPVQSMLLEDGVPFAEDIVFEVASAYDGERIWIFPADDLVHTPEWMRA
jgi:hypothetical protein